MISRVHSDKVPELVECTSFSPPAATEPAGQDCVSPRMQMYAQGVEKKVVTPLFEVANFGGFGM